VILTVEDTAEAGKRCRVFDARGDEIVYAFHADTDTGIVGQFVLDDQGRPMNDGIELFREFRVYAAPLRIEWIEE
jgi:hypothetical protein